MFAKILITLLAICSAESLTRIPGPFCNRSQCEPTFCPNPIQRGCCDICFEDCRVIFCARPDCSNPITPPGRCCPVCPTDPTPPIRDCSRIQCFPPACPNPKLPGPGKCCPSCLENCAVVSCVLPTCSNPITPPGRCCPVCPSPPLPVDCSAVLCAVPTCPNPIPPPPGQCCSRCLQDCRLVRCARPNCDNPTTPQGQCCPVCPPVPTNICDLPSVTGPCRASLPRWFYNSKTKQCERFTYGGCGGNENRFNDLQSCLNQCAGKCPPGVPLALCFADPCSVTRCPSFPNSICVSNFCGGCNARFFLSNGKEVTERCRQNTCPAGQIFSSCGRTCNPTCEDQRPSTCIGSCTSGCACPKGTVLDRRVSKCVDSDDCGECPPGKTPVFCLINPCDQTTCSNIPKAECLFDNCDGCFARFFVGTKEVTDQCKLTGTTCPIQGQVFQQCKSCPITCTNKNILCREICQPGCGCPAGQIIDEANNRCVPRNQCPITKCSIKGQVFQQCRTCPATCNNPNLICTADCRPGCGCPPGQLIDEQNKRCVPSNQCPNECKIEGQVYQQCRTCPATCNSFNLPCPRVCRPGCGCPPGQLIDQKLNKCVPIGQCSNQKCPIPGQTFQRCRPCLITCKDIQGPPIACTLECIPGCGCPPGTVLDERSNRCVKRDRCPSITDCSRVLCPLVACPNPIPADPSKGRCCQTCRPGSQCPIRGQVFRQCGSACEATCRNRNPICITVCQPGCSCPAGQVINEKTRSCVPQNRCPVTLPGNRCLLPLKRGTCKARHLRYHYNSRTRRCHAFIYGGCGGNSNNFTSRYACERSCRKYQLRG